MKISINTNLLDIRFGLKKAIDILAKAGFDAVDFSLFRSEYYTDVHDEAFYREIKMYTEDKGLYINQSHAPFDNYFPVEGKTKLCVQHFINAMKHAALTGAKTIVVHPCQCQEYHREGSPEELFECNMDYYRKLIPYCEEFNIKVAIENMWQHQKGMISHSVCSRPEEFEAYLEELNNLWFVACLDIGHAVLVRENPEEFIRTLGGNKLKSLHVHDVDGIIDSHTLPFLGAGNWQKIMKALAEINYDGELTFEVDGFMRQIPDELLPESVTFAAKVGKYLSDQFETYKKSVV